MRRKEGRSKKGLLQLRNEEREIRYSSPSVVFFQGLNVDSFCSKRSQFIDKYHPGAVIINELYANRYLKDKTEEP